MFSHSEQLKQIQPGIKAKELFKDAKKRKIEIKMSARRFINIFCFSGI